MIKLVRQHLAFKVASYTEPLLVSQQKGIEVYQYSNEVPDNICDVIISNHALEHTINPYEELKILYLKLKKNGKIVFVVPNEKKNRWNSDDINKHLYTWSEMNIGNLFDKVGFDVLTVQEIHHRWPPKYLIIYDLLGNTLFHVVCRMYGLFRRNLSQIKIVAMKR